MTLRQRPVVVGPRQAQGRRYDVLVVDPDAHMRILVLGILKGMDLNGISGVSNMADTMDHLNKTPPRVIVVNFALPGLTGVNLLHALRWGADSPARELPFLLYGANLERSDIIAARDAGVSELMTAPLTGQGIHARIKAMIERPRPFVMTPRFIGPSRRRRQHPFAGSDRRNPDAVAAAPGLTHTFDQIARQPMPIIADRARQATSVGMVAPGQITTADISTKAGATVIAKGTVLSAQMVVKLRDMVTAGLLAASLPVSAVGVEG